MWKHKYLPFSWGKKKYGDSLPNQRHPNDSFSGFKKTPPGYIDGVTSSSTLSPTPFAYEDSGVGFASGISLGAASSASFNDMGMTSTLNENTFGRITTPLSGSSMSMAHASGIALEPLQIPSTMKKVK